MCELSIICMYMLYISEHGLKYSTVDIEYYMCMCFSLILSMFSSSNNAPDTIVYVQQSCKVDKTVSIHKFNAVYVIVRVLEFNIVYALKYSTPVHSSYSI